MKKLVAVILVVIVLMGSGAVYAVHLPEFTLYRMVQEVKQNGIEQIEDYLSESIKPLFDTAMKLVKSSWLADLMELDATQQLLASIEDENAFSWKLLEVRHGRKTASALIAVSSGTFEAQISLEMIREDGRWLINGATIPQFSRK